MNDLTMIIFLLQAGGCPIPDSSSETFAKRLLSVIPAKAGIHNKLKILDSRLHGNDHLDYLWQNSKVSVKSLRLNY